MIWQGDKTGAHYVVQIGLEISIFYPSIPILEC